MPTDFTVNYEILDHLIQDFEISYDAFNALYQKLNTIVEDLHEFGWRGQASDKFYAEMMNDIFPRLKRICEAMEQSRLAIQQIQSIIAEAEEDAMDSIKRTII